MNIVFNIIVILIVIAAVLLVAVVLLQNGKDGGLATNFTSANQTLGVRQTATILEKATWYLVAFILVLAIVSVFTLRSGRVASGDNLGNEILNEAEAGQTEEIAVPSINQIDPSVQESNAQEAESQE